ncbi:MAG: ATP-grasp domain-containing protein [Eggerthellaceae bacterium]|nr:ATP-grasp domain-containing protein [Eggerthellaceae bacterium]
MSTNLKKIAIMGASELQKPLILKAKEIGVETHVFAWPYDAEGKNLADFFYPISLTDCDEILAKCRMIDVDGACSIASDLGNSTASYVANHIGLIYNSAKTVACSTNKILMHRCFIDHGVSSPKFVELDSATDLQLELDIPFIIKPADRSGSRGVKKITQYEEIGPALEAALNYSFAGAAVAEEFVEGEEFSVEYISHGGRHYFLAVTKKFTTGSPNFIELGHIEPARLGVSALNQIRAETEHALDALNVSEGPSHTELKINERGVFIIEIGTRMGGDCIGSNLVQLSTGFDFVEAMFDIYLGLGFEAPAPKKVQAAAVLYFFKKEDLRICEALAYDQHVNIVERSSFDFNNKEVVDSSSRKGFFICTCADVNHLYEIFEEHKKKINKQIDFNSSKKKLHFIINSFCTWFFVFYYCLCDPWQTLSVDCIRAQATVHNVHSLRPVAVATLV